MIEQQWDAFIAALVAAYAEYNAIAGGEAYALSEDDKGMKDADAQSIIEWVDDMEARLSLDVDAVRYHMWEYIDYRESAIAAAIVAEAFGDADKVVPHDPRGVFVAGAEIESPNSEYNPIGFYMYEDGAWVIACYDDNGEHDAMCDGNGNYDRAQVVALLREKFAALR